jgi:hypothetical protein
MNACLHVCMCIKCMTGIHGGQKRASHPLHLGLQKSCYKLQHGCREPNPSSTRAARALNHGLIHLCSLPAWPVCDLDGTAAPVSFRDISKKFNVSPGMHCPQRRPCRYSSGSVEGAENTVPKRMGEGLPSADPWGWECRQTATT